MKQDYILGCEICNGKKKVVKEEFKEVIANTSLEELEIALEDDFDFKIASEEEQKIFRESIPTLHKNKSENILDLLGYRVFETHENCPTCNGRGEVLTEKGKIFKQIAAF